MDLEQQPKRSKFAHHSPHHVAPSAAAIDSSQNFDNAMPYIMQIQDLAMQKNEAMAKLKDLKNKLDLTSRYLSKCKGDVAKLKELVLRKENIAHQILQELNTVKRRLHERQMSSHEVLAMEEILGERQLELRRAYNTGRKKLAMMST